MAFLLNLICIHEMVVFLKEGIDFELPVVTLELKNLHAQAVLVPRLLQQVILASSFTSGLLMRSKRDNFAIPTAIGSINGSIKPPKTFDSMINPLVIPARHITPS